MAQHDKLAGFLTFKTRILKKQKKTKKTKPQHLVTKLVQKIKSYGQDPLHLSSLQHLTGHVNFSSMTAL